MPVESDTALRSIARVDCSRRQRHQRRPVSSVQRNLADLRRFDRSIHLRIVAIQRFARRLHLDGIRRCPHRKSHIHGPHLSVKQVHIAHDIRFESRFAYRDLVLADWLRCKT